MINYGLDDRLYDGTEAGVDKASGDWLPFERPSSTAFSNDWRWQTLVAEKETHR